MNDSYTSGVFRRGGRDVKILCEVKETGALRCSKNNKKPVIVVWAADWALLSTQSAAASVQFKYFKTHEQQFASKIKFLS